MKHTRRERLKVAHAKFVVNPDNGMVANRGSGRLKKLTPDKYCGDRVKFWIGNSLEGVGIADLILWQECGEFDTSGYMSIHADGNVKNHNIENLILQPRTKKDN